MQSIQLPEPQTDGGRPLMQVLKDRKSSRGFSPEPLPLQILSDLLWAAFGVDRPESGMRTAPSAINWQEIDIYVSLANGLYLFDADQHLLKPILAEDVRAYTGVQSFVAQAPLNLIFVADYARVNNVSESRRALTCAADAGFISQNVYLYCASQGLATVLRALIDRKSLAEKMGLRQDQDIIFAQTVGYPDK